MPGGLLHQLWLGWQHWRRNRREFINFKLYLSEGSRLLESPSDHNIILASWIHGPLAVSATESLFVRRMPIFEMLRTKLRAKHPEAFSEEGEFDVRKLGVLTKDDFGKEEQEELLKWNGVERLETWAQFSDGQWQHIMSNGMWLEHVHHMMNWWLYGREFRIDNDAACGRIKFSWGEREVEAGLRLSGIVMELEGEFRKALE